MFHIINDNDFEYSRNPPLTFTCTFCCETENGAFPSEDRSDFAVTVPEWWCRVVKETRCPEKTTFKLLFEDGPYRIEGRERTGPVFLRFASEHKRCGIPDIAVRYDDWISEIDKAIRHPASAFYFYGDKNTSQFPSDMAHALRNCFGM